jgi:hypothetical protein
MLEPMMLKAEYNMEIITHNILRFVTCFLCMFRDWVHNTQNFGFIIQNSIEDGEIIPKNCILIKVQININ